MPSYLTEAQRDAICAKVNAQAERAMRPTSNERTALAYWKLARSVMEGLRARREMTAWCSKAMTATRHRDNVASLELVAIYRRKAVEHAALARAERAAAPAVVRAMFTASVAALAVEAA